MFGGALALLPAAAIGRGAIVDPVARTAAAMGGQHLLDRVAAIGWLGAAEVVTPEKTLRLGVETRIEPFVRARSNSWVMTEGVAKARSLIIEPTGGWMERDGKRTALPAHQARHEREQYGLYGYMLMRAPTAAAGDRLLAAHPGLPPVSFETGPDGRLSTATYTVFAPDGGEVIQERFTFDGTVNDKGLRWPRRLRIAQNGVPFFTLVIDRFMVELH
ncbi:hypothetical protein G4G27_09080 [Sphingomonas sp. So64.6b]|uniref:hypothetical protein n=1 Tax=Sphingomonas sp. So64.6b TaxID=2997354 RepID=UPI001601639C|nr:hypothetical protein [Sphingomonas sp. So64.6b]QNA84122.1 hypothetical protein G4G27_09080 [Sphingomonas sp. So64.6b]